MNKFNTILQPAAGKDDERKKHRSSLIKLLIMLVLSLVIWIFATIAWFAMNDTVNAGGMGVTVASESYQILPLTENDDPEAGAVVRESVFERFHIGSSKSSDAAVWTMSAESDMNNFDNDAVGIYPGSYGSISFYVKPRDSYIDLDLTFRIKGYLYTPGSTDTDTGVTAPASMTAMPELDDYLAGHIFLFEERSIEYYKDANDQDTDKIKRISYSKPILSGISLDKAASAKRFSKAAQDTPVKIYWVWPRTLSTLVYAMDNENVNIEPFCDYGGSNGSDTTYSEIIGNITGHPERYFYEYSQERTLTAEGIATAYDTYGPLYDQVDNEIGKSVNFITLNMTTAEAAASP